MRDLLRRCLAKDAKQRLHHVADARIDIEAARSDPGTEPPRPASAAATHGRRGFSVPAWSLLLAVAATAVIVGAWLRTTAVPPASPIRLVLDLPPDQTLVEAAPAGATLSARHGSVRRDAAGPPTRV